MAEDPEATNSFMNALISESNIESEKHTVTGKSVNEIINESNYFANHVRCVCGVHAGSDDLVQCSMCSMYLHRNCIRLPIDFNETIFVCPFCLFQNYSIDPLSTLANAYELFNTQILSICSLLKRLEDLEKQSMLFADSLSKPQISNAQRVTYDEKHRQSLAIFSQISAEWKEKSHLVRTIQRFLHTVPPYASPTNSG